MITLETLPQATQQEVFDQVAAHLITQGRRSVEVELTGEEDGGCRYLSPSGLKCAAGCLIGQKEYISNMEGYSWSKLSKDRLVPITHTQLITALQIVHDGWGGDGPITSRLRGMAEEWHLDDSIIQTTLENLE